MKIQDKSFMTDFRAVSTNDWKGPLQSSWATSMQRFFRNDAGYEEVTAYTWTQKERENTQKFMNAWALTSLVTGGRIIPHQGIHETTWASLDHITEHQIDHSYINKMFRRSRCTVQVSRRANAYHQITISELLNWSWTWRKLAENNKKAETIQ